ncbi:hypothetical protein [Halobellus ordinarius]|uniref:hypothetical protein n=1 Tax=Halobellus ordinarius TaxID=3075120 RepID=UPI0028801C63|nr:hypothetical protein [Halobellus sp. ZY16]
MARDFTFGNFLKEVGMRLGAAVVVVSVFLGVGYFNRTNFLGLSSVLGTQASFVAVSLALIGLISLSWIGIQQYRQ